MVLLTVENAKRLHVHIGVLNKTIFSFNNHDFRYTQTYIFTEHIMTMWVDLKSSGGIRFRPQLIIAAKSFNVCLIKSDVRSKHQMINIRR
jgi:hypothetical protein